MSRSDRTYRTPGVLAGLVAAIALVGLAPAPAAAAEDYDVDCKLILCLPAGFPSGCSDAYKHMVKRLRHGKSPIGFCALSDGTEYDAFDIDYHVIPATRPQGWECPVGKNLYHTSRTENDGDTLHHVNTFCYDTAYTYGWGNPPRFTNKTRPERMDFEINMTVEPDTPMAYSAGWQRFDADIASDWSTDVRYSE